MEDNIVYIPGEEYKPESTFLPPQTQSYWDVRDKPTPDNVHPKDERRRCKHCDCYEDDCRCYCPECGTRLDGGWCDECCCHPYSDDDDEEEEED